MTCQAVVRHVLSGDTLIVLLEPKGQEKPRETLAKLACLEAPRLCVSGQVTENPSESGGWEARERLRSLLIGKVIDVEILAELNDRPHMSVALGAVDIAYTLASEGHVKVQANAMCCPENIDQLLMAVQDARAKKLGIWADTPAAPRAQKSIVGDSHHVTEWCDRRKGKIVSAVVEDVRDGGTLRVSVVDDKLFAQILLTGVTVDKWHRDATEGSVVADEYAEEAQKFVEARLLGRLLNFRIDGNDNYGNIFGTAIHPKGNISEILLKEGFARLNDFSFSMAPHTSDLRAALQKAKNERVRKWKNLVVEAKLEKREYTARIIEVHSGDTISILELEKGVVPTPYDLLKDERRVYLSSIRCPRGRTRTREAEPWSFQAMETTSELCAGKKCRVVVDYIRTPMPSNGAELPPASDDLGRLHFVTIFHAGKNSVNMELVKRGLAKTQRHRADEDRSAVYDDLVAAEQEAIISKTGVFSSDPAPKRRVNDLTGATNTRKARELENSFRRLGKMAGQIEAVISGSRFRTRIPSESAVMTVILSGIRTPQTPRLQQGILVPGQPLAEESVAWSRLNLLHKKVSFSVSGCDRGGAFICEMYLNNSKTSVQEDLLRVGLAYTDEGSLRLCGISEKLVEAELEGRNAVIGVWALPEMLEAKQALADKLAQDNESLANTPSTSAPTERPSFHTSIMNDCIVSHVDDVNSFYIQPDVEKLDFLQDMCNEIGDEADGAEETAWRVRFSAKRKPRKGDLLLVRYSEDDQWYRAIVETLLETTPQATVFYVDYGNRSKVGYASMLPCPPSMNLINQPPLAIHVFLGGVQTLKDMHAEAGDALHDRTISGTYSVEIIGPKNGLGAVPVVLNKPKGKSINTELLSEGLVKLAKGIDKSLAFYEVGKAAEQAARVNRKGMWFYGDIGDSDDGADED